MARAAKDARIERTRQAVLGAFVQIVLEGRRYDRIKVADLIERAGVGRSTFYEHFRNKDEVLAESIRHPFALLADAVVPGYDVARLRSVLVHFRENRLQARVLFAGAARRELSRVLASMIEERLRSRAKKRGIASSASIGIAAVAIADGQLAAIVSWLGDGVARGEATLAQTLHCIAQASAREICGS
jgi:AcrR family transcriptional regulator